MDEKAPSSSPKLNGARWAFLVAFQAGNALFCHIVVHSEIVLVRNGFHGTNPVARAAIDTLGIAEGEYGCKPIEQGQACTEGTEDLAEEAPMSHGQQHYSKQYSQSYPEMQGIRCSVDKCPGNGGFDRGHRAEPAEVQRKFWGQEVGDSKHEPKKHPILDKSRPARNGELRVRNLVQQVLNKTKRAGPPAQDPSSHQAYQSHDPDDTEGNQGDPSELAHYPQRAGKQGGRTGVAIQDRQAYEMPLEYSQIQNGSHRDLHFSSQFFHVLYPYQRRVGG